MADASPLLRGLDAAEVEMLIDWAAAEGWNPGLADAAAFRVADPEAFIGAFVDGRMAAGIAAVRYGANFGFIGLYISRPDMRGRGYGKLVWDAGMARLAGRTVGLDGVPAQQANYRSMGFVPSYRTFRHSGRLEAATGIVNGIAPVTPDLYDAVAAFDRAFFPAGRPDFLRRWLSPPHIALASLAGRTVRGYGVARACRVGFKVGPLFAEGPEIAMALLGALALRSGGDIHIDVPEVNPAFSATLLEAGLFRGFETARMYRGLAPSIEMCGVFGVTTLELG